jgi:hypothetical protein
MREERAENAKRTCQEQCSPSRSLRQPAQHAVGSLSRSASSVIVHRRGSVSVVVVAAAAAVVLLSSLSAVAVVLDHCLDCYSAPVGQ